MTPLRALRRLPPLETAILAVAVAALAALGFAARERSAPQAQLDSYSSYDAAGGGYRAFYQLLAREGVAVARFRRRPAFLDASIDTLVYAEPLPFDRRQVTASAGDVASLEAWVRAGGRLLYVGHDDAAARRGILSLPQSSTAAARGDVRVVAPELAARGVRVLASPANLHWKLVRRGGRVLLGGPRGPIAVGYPFGRGYVTALIDESLFENAAIAVADRARLAYALAAPGRAGRLVAFDETPHGFLIPSRWWTLVPRTFAIALVLAFAVIFIAIAGAAVRLGPPLVVRDAHDRSAAGFIDAFASLLERGRAAHTALADSAASARHAVFRALGLAWGTPHAEVASYIEQADLRDAYRTLAALVERGRLEPASFVRGIALAQRLRKEFAAHGRRRN